LEKSGEFKSENAIDKKDVSTPSDVDETKLKITIDKKLFFIIIVVIMTISMFVFFKSDSLKVNIEDVIGTKSSDQFENAANELSERGVVKVAGSVITESQLNNEYNKIDLSIKNEVSKQEFAEYLIDKKLIEAEAKKKGISVINNELESIISDQLKANGLSRNEFEQRLADSGTSFEEYKRILYDSMLFSQLLQEDTNIEKIEVSDKEVKQFIEENKEAFNDFFEEDLVSMLENRVRMQLLKEKQQEVTEDYIAKLRNKAGIQEAMEN